MRVPQGNGRLSTAFLGLCFLILQSPSRLWVSSFQHAGRIAAVSSPLNVYHRAISIKDRHQNIPSAPSSKSTSSSSLFSFMGSDGGLFGIGTPEIATILLVGYFVLGPSDLYKLVKEIGKFIQNIRTLGTEATKTFENSMESQLELQEIRKAQRELNDAFSFRRSINVDQDASAFTDATGPVEPELGVPVAAAATTAGASTLPERKKKRRRVKKKQPIPEPTLESSTGEIPDLDMSEVFDSDESTSPAANNSKDDSIDWFADGFPSASDMAKEDITWLEDLDTNEKKKHPTTTPTVSTAPVSEEQLRFQQQLSSQWNQKVMDNEEKLSPLALIMEKLALLEEEKATAEKRLEDEFRQRFKLEDDFYRKKRELLEEAAVKVQEDAYVTMEGASSGNDSKK